MNEIIQIARSRTPAATESVPTLPDFIPLAPDDDAHFVIDTTAMPFVDGEEAENIVENTICPDTLDEMLRIVRSLRQERIARLQLLQVPPLMIVTPASTREGRADRSANANNVDVVNLADLMEIP